MITYDEIFENNRKWIAQKKGSDVRFFEKLVQDQNPAYLYIGCSDSRVTAEEIMGADPGEIFVHRNIANIVSNCDLNTLSVIQYAVTHLGVEHVIICGHYNCGGVKAAMQAKNLGILNPWLRNVRDVYRLHKKELSGISNEEHRYQRLVQLNVQEQCLNVIKTAAVQEAYAATGKPVVHGWVFDLSTGELIDLKVDFQGMLQQVKEIYDLTGPARTT